MSSQERIRGYVVGSDRIADGSIQWIVKGKWPLDYADQKFPVDTKSPGTVLTPGLEVTFRLGGVIKQRFAYDVAAHNPVFVDASLKPKQVERSFELDLSGAHVIARTIFPSPRFYSWPGNTVTIRKWEVCPMGETIFHNCDKEEILCLEKILGEWKNPRVVRHLTLGLVSTEE